MRHAALFCIILALALTAAAPDRARAQVYEIEQGDRLSISVLEDPGLNTTVLVRPDGKISMPLAGVLDAEGKTPEALQAAIQRALAPNFVQQPTVTVTLVSLGDGGELLPVVYILGEVARPGVFPIEEDRTLDVLQALALAGGPGPFAATGRIQVRRADAAGGQTMLLFDYASVLEGLVQTDRVLLADGDIIVVPERGLFE